MYIHITHKDWCILHKWFLFKYDFWIKYLILGEIGYDKIIEILFLVSFIILAWNPVLYEITSDIKKIMVGNPFQNINSLN